MSKEAWVTLAVNQPIVGVLVAALGAADEFPELPLAAQRHRQLWGMRDRVVPLLLTGPWWGECASE